MAAHRANLSGKRFGMLTALHVAEHQTHGSILWVCRCDCGNERNATASMLGSGHATHCGCQTSANMSSAKRSKLRKYKSDWERKKRAAGYACKPVRPNGGPIDRFLYAHPSPSAVDAGGVA